MNKNKLLLILIPLLFTSCNNESSSISSNPISINSSDGENNISNTITGPTYWKYNDISYDISSKEYDIGKISDECDTILEYQCSDPSNAFNKKDIITNATDEYNLELNKHYTIRLTIDIEIASTPIYLIATYENDLKYTIFSESLSLSLLCAYDDENSNRYFYYDLVQTSHENIALNFNLKGTDFDKSITLYFN
jgi:hypothetical protein